jgi:hypothetical protein
MSHVILSTHRSPEQSHLILAKVRSHSATDLARCLGAYARLPAYRLTRLTA